MDVGCGGEKRQYAEKETHEETENIEIRPGHKSPRARHLLSQLAVAVRELEFESRTLLTAPATMGRHCSIAKWRGRRRLPAPLRSSSGLIIARTENFS